VFHTRFVHTVFMLGLIGSIAAPSARTGASAGTPIPASSAPWGLEALGSEAISPAQFMQALPEEFVDPRGIRYYLVRDLDPAIAQMPVYAFASASETMRYYAAPQPVDVPVAVVTITTLPDDMTPAEALGAIQTGASESPVVAIERANFAAEADVPYILGEQYGGDAAGTVPVLIWGTGDGDRLFTISALKREDLETLISLLAVRLSGDLDINITGTPTAMSTP
jgi:hypothetical protein